MKYTVALIYGGEGFEREISKRSRDGLYPLINKKLFDVKDVYISECGEWFLSDGENEKIPTFPIFKGGRHGLSLGEKILDVDLAVPCLHGDFGEDGIITGTLLAAHIPTLSADTYSSALSADKAYTKAACEYLKIPTAKWRLSVGETAEEALLNSEKSLAYPMFIKPARLGSSFGAYPVKSREDFIFAFNSAKSLAGDRILIEKCVNIKYELECALYGAKEKRLLAAGTVHSDGIFYDFKAKYNSNEIRTEVVSTEEGSNERALAEKYSKILVDFIGLSLISRIDFFVTDSGEVLFNEINTFPGMTKTSLYPKMAELLSGKEGFINELLLSLLNARRI